MCRKRHARSEKVAEAKLARGCRVVKIEHKGLRQDRNEQRLIHALKLGGHLLHGTADGAEEALAHKGLDTRRELSLRRDGVVAAECEGLLCEQEGKCGVVETGHWAAERWHGLAAWACVQAACTTDADEFARANPADEFARANQGRAASAASDVLFEGRFMRDHQPCGKACRVKV